VRLESKVCVVSGAASGIGRAVSERFRAEGARVAALDRVPIDDEPTAGLSLVCDVSDETSVAESFEQIAAALGPVDALVTSAGVALESEFTETRLADWNNVLAVNLTGSFLCAKHAVRRRSGACSLVFISSMSALVATADEAAYCASKAGVIGLARSIAVDCASLGVRSNCICPGVIDTPMNEPMWAARGAEFRRVVEQSHPLGRLGRPDDIAQMAVFLASDESTFVTGSSFVADGGYTSR
jgi:meso-butanediol dehydrogenase/(S,S)-butanediol dehydrogenase/diacetyl reductase